MNKFQIDDTIELGSDLQNVSVVEKLIDNQSAVCELSEEIYGKLLLAVVEAVNNAIVHGNNEDPSKIVTIHYIVNNQQIQYIISNQGEPFDPSSLPDPTAPENLEKDCGRGIFLMRHLADSVEYTDEGRTVTLTFNLEE